VRGREEIFFGAEFDASAGTNKLPDEAVTYYIDRLKDDRDALRGSFELYRAFIATAKQNVDRMKQKLTLPVLAIGGAESSGAIIPPATAPNIENTVMLVADNVQTVVVPGAHWVAEQAPEEIVAALTTFLAPYRDVAVAAR
jgi:pimeloyl-ACP methyl ester carboxylesterase